MALVKLRGIALRETPFGDYDTYLSVLTEDGRRVEVLCKNVRRSANKQGAAARPFCFSEFNLSESRGKLTLREADRIAGFWGLTQQIEDYALACYFAELICALTDDTQENPPICRELLFALHALERGQRDRDLVKAALEWRLMAESGYMPQLTACGVCGAELAEMPHFFSVRDGAGACADCAGRVGGYPPLRDGCRRALYHALTAPPEKLFAFTLEPAAAAQFTSLGEQYALYHLERSFDTLRFYHSLQAQKKSPKKQTSGEKPDAETAEHRDE